jgi:hypothetical protein
VTRGACRARWRPGLAASTSAGSIPGSDVDGAAVAGGPHRDTSSRRRVSRLRAAHRESQRVSWHLRPRFESPTHHGGNRGTRAAGAARRASN